MKQQSKTNIKFRRSYKGKENRGIQKKATPGTEDLAGLGRPLPALFLVC